MILRKWRMKTRLQKNGEDDAHCTSSVSCDRDDGCAGGSGEIYSSHYRSAIRDGGRCRSVGGLVYTTTYTMSLYRC